MPHWQKYQPGMTIVGQRVRASSAASGQNVYNTALNTTVPVGLVGKCELVQPANSKLVFRKDQDDNEYLWSRIKNMVRENLSGGLLALYVPPPQLVFFEVEVA